ncbi:MAG: ABC transporter permease [Oscillibacter sp.]|nr:ABC transporter permease [Oscillibacter sp.]
MLNFVNALPGAVSQGLIWGIMAIGVYITYKILDVADLTVDGSFCTGAAVFVMLFTTGTNLWLAMLAALLVGMLAGLATGLLHTFCGIPAILSGILTQLGLWSINLAVMDMKSTVAINVTNNEFLDKLLVSLRFVQDVAKGARPFYKHPILVVGVFTAALIAVLYWFFGTELGCALRATGSNPSMARAQGINTDFTKVLGLMISNGLVALSGALLAQFNSASEINMGRGAIVIGLASVIIGQVLFGKIFRNFALKLTAVSIGAILYYIVIQAVLAMGLNANYLKLLSALVVAVFLSIPYWKGKYIHVPVKTGGASHA